MADKPTAAFVLSLIGGIIYLIVGLIIAGASAVVGSYAGMAGFPGVGLAVAAVGAIGLVSGIVIIIGAIMMNNDNKSKVKTGSILVLVFTIVGALFTVGGFFIGFILGLIGSILGLTWKGSATMSTSAPMPSTAPPS